MSTYSLSGSGTHALTASTTGLQVTITTPSVLQGVGTANPANHYHTGMLRFSDGTAYWDPVPITGGPQFIPVPQNATSFGYALQGGAEVSVTEVIGGTVFFSGGASSVATLSDVTLASLADGQVLQWNASAGKWENAAPAAGSARAVLHTYDEASDVSLVTNTTTWSDWHSHTFSVTDSTAPIEFHVAGYTVGDNAGAHGMGSRLLLDGASAFALSGMYGGNSDPLGGGTSVLLGTLSIGSHTVKVQMRGDSADTIRCRAATRNIYGERYSVYITQG